MLQVSDLELWILSNYVASELSGALILGTRARQTDSDFIRSQCTWHCNEEMRHSLKWVELIQKLGGMPLEIHDKEGDHYYARAGMPKNDIELLAFVHVFERRVPFHLYHHAKRPNSHPLVIKLIAELIEDEEEHLGWMLKEIRKHINEGKADEVDAALMRHAKIEQEVYQQYIDLLESKGGELVEFVQTIRQSAKNYDILKVIRADLAGQSIPQFKVRV